MSDVNSDKRDGAQLPKNKLTIDAALSDWIYHRNKDDQGLSLSEIMDDATVININHPDKVYNAGLDNFLYGNNGFVAVVIKKEDNYIIVYRGTDSASLIDSDLSDVAADYALGRGAYTKGSQADSAVTLAKRVLELAGGDSSKVHIVGQSLGGGLGGLAAAAIGATATLIAPAPFGYSLYPIAIDAILGANNMSLPPGYNNITLLRAAAEDDTRTAGDYVFDNFGETEHNRIVSDVDNIYKKYVDNLNSSNVSVYRNIGEFLTSKWIGGAINIFSNQFKEAADSYDLGSGDSLALHNPTLSALEIRSIDARSKDQDFGFLLRNDAFLRNIFIGNESYVAGSRNKDRSDTITTSSKVGSSDGGVGILERALWKSIGSDTPLYDDLYRLFDTTLSAGAAAEGRAANTINNNTVHAGLTRLILSAMRDFTVGTSTLNDVKDRLNGQNFSFSGDGSRSDEQDKVVVRLSDTVSG